MVEQLRQIMGRINELATRIKRLEAQEPPGFQTGSGAPGSTPNYTGEWYLDTTNDKWYRAADTSGSGDWKALN